MRTVILFSFSDQELLAEAVRKYSRLYNCSSTTHTSKIKLLKIVKKLMKGGGSKETQVSLCSCADREGVCLPQAVKEHLLIPTVVSLCDKFTK